MQPDSSIPDQKPSLCGNGNNNYLRLQKKMTADDANVACPHNGTSFVGVNHRIVNSEPVSKELARFHTPHTNNLQKMPLRHPCKK